MLYKYIFFVIRFGCVKFRKREIESNNKNNNGGVFVVDYDYYDLI